MTVFVDTNVLVYARDAADPLKQTGAVAWIDQLWNTNSGRLSTQVLNEYYVTMTRKLQPGMSSADARADVRDLLSWEPLPITRELIEDAWTIEDRFGLSYWDSLIVAAAQESGCAYLLTEDLQDGQDVHGVLVLNPFTNQPDKLK